MRTMLSALALPLLIGCVGDPGPQGVPGEPGTQGPQGPQGPQAPAAVIEPVLTLLTPARGFPDRSVLLQVSGVGTHFKADTRVRLDDPEITVGRISVGSAGYLTAELRTSIRARLGAHDLTVETQAPAGPEAPALKGSFHIVPSLVADAQGNTSAPQGGLVDFNLRSVDRDSPPVGTAVLSGDVRALYLSTLSGRAVGYGLVDALATAGGLPLALTFDSGGNKLGYVLDPADPAAPKTTARAATALTLGTALGGEKIAAPRTTSLYKITTEGDAQVVQLSFVTSGGLSASTVAGAIAPDSGKWSEGQLFYASVSGTTQTALALGGKKGTHYLTVLPASLGGGADYGYSITARAEAAKTVSLKESDTSPDTPAAPLGSITLDQPHVSSDAALESAGDLDYVKITAKKSGRLYVQATTSGLGLSAPATTVALFQADCTTQLAPPRAVQQEIAVSADLTYCARISSSTGYLGAYRLLVSQ